MSKTAVNIEFVAGNEFHPSLWEVQREDWSIACSVSDSAPLKDCTDSRARPGRNLFRLGGKNGIAYWGPTSVHKNTLTSNRTIAFYKVPLNTIFGGNVINLYFFMFSLRKPDVGLPRFNPNRCSLCSYLWCHTI